jgi:hypothetical protein
MSVGMNAAPTAMRIAATNQTARKRAAVWPRGSGPPLRGLQFSLAGLTSLRVGCLIFRASGSPWGFSASILPRGVFIVVVAPCGFFHRAHRAVCKSRPVCGQPHGAEAAEETSATGRGSAARFLRAATDRQPGTFSLIERSSGLRSGRTTHKRIRIEFFAVETIRQLAARDFPAVFAVADAAATVSASDSTGVNRARRPNHRLTVLRRVRPPRRVCGGGLRPLPYSVWRGRWGKRVRRAAPEGLLRRPRSPFCMGFGGARKRKTR